VILALASLALAEVGESRPLMGTEFHVTVNAGDTPAVRTAIDAALDEIARIEALASRWQPASPLSRVNDRAGAGPVAVGRELVALVERAVGLCGVTGERFDVTFRPLGMLWDQQPPVVPSDAAVQAARSLVDCHAIALTDDQIGLPVAGMAIDLGGIAKGYAVDRASAQLSAAGLPDHLVDGGGDMLARGSSADGPWVVGIRHPRAQALIGAVELTDQALVTSGDYERYVEIDGQRYHHVIDPRTGWPAAGFASVTVLADTTERADALATALLVAGPTEAAGLLSELPEVEAFMIAPDGEFWRTEGFPVRHEESVDAGEALGIPTLDGG